MVCNNGINVSSPNISVRSRMSQMRIYFNLWQETSLFNFSHGKWAHKDSNLGHADYESAALTIWAMGPFQWNTIITRFYPFSISFFEYPSKKATDILWSPTLIPKESLQCLMYNFMGSILDSFAMVIPEKQAIALTTNASDTPETIPFFWLDTKISSSAWHLCLCLSFQTIVGAIHELPL